MNHKKIRSVLWAIVIGVFSFLVLRKLKAIFFGPVDAVVVTDGNEDDDDGPMTVDE